MGFAVEKQRKKALKIVKNIWNRSKTRKQWKILLKCNRKPNPEQVKIWVEKIYPSLCSLSFFFLLFSYDIHGIFYVLCQFFPKEHQFRPSAELHTPTVRLCDVTSSTRETGKAHCHCVVPVQAAQLPGIDMITPICTEEGEKILLGSFAQTDLGKSANFASQLQEDVYLRRSCLL